MLVTTSRKRRQRVGGHPAVPEPAEHERPATPAHIPTVLSNGDTHASWRDVTADIELAQRLRADGFDSPHGELFLARCTQFAYGMLRALIQSGEIFQRAAGLGRPVRATPAITGDTELCHELVTETVVDGISLFKTALADGHWDPTRGASLRTYFINACVLAFPNAYRRIVARETRWNADPIESEDLDSLRYAELTPSRGPATAAGELDIVTRLLARVEPDVRNVLWYLAEGYTQKEIASSLGVSHRAIESKLHRVRAQLRAMARDDEPSAGRHRIHDQSGRRFPPASA